MKASFTLITLALLTGCSHLKPVQNPAADLQKSESVKTDPVNNPADKKTLAIDKANNSDKTKILTPVHVDTLPPLSATDTFKNTNNSSTTPKSTSTLLATPKAEPKVAGDLEQISPFKILKVGSRGAAVLALKKRLAELYYDVGDVNGFYDKQTRQAVLAFQKYNELDRTGTYTLETQQALLEATPAEGLHPELGLPRIEIDLSRQVLLFFDEKGLNRVVAVSTGSERKYCERSKKSGRRVCGVALTPLGTFHIQRKIPGWRESDLGKLYNPLYFSGGFAIHGAPSVPAYNASHGCVRISVSTSLWFYDSIKNGTPVILFD